ncbi:methionine/alanine import family NSS transporter small subunit [Alkalihalobacterium alkalinitrilicum]|nr:methionine/alanine import family NSS transporter small subunit [Alkalihalobacterium alkalinitrilicum]
MSASAITMMLVGIAIVWGGLALSIINAVKVSKNK